MSSLFLSSSSLMKPSLPIWLENLIQRLADNDTSLTSVELTTPRIDDVGARAFAKAMEDNSNVTTLILSCLDIVDDGAYAIGRVIGGGDEAIGHTCATYVCSQTLTKLQFRDLRISRDAVTFYESLLPNTCIEELSLRYSHVDHRDSLALGRLLAVHPRLQEIRIVDTQISQGCLKSICQGIGASRSIQRFYLTNVELNEFDAQHISDMLLDSRCGLRELHLAENSLGDEGVETIAIGLQSNASVRLLDLRSNGITENGALAIQGLLVSSKHLICLGLASNELLSLGTTAIARGLAHSNCVLQKLDLTNNGITGRGALALSRMLRYNRRLVDLNLSINHLGDAGTRALADGIARNTTLERISLLRNGITNRGATAIAEKLPRMIGLKELTLAKNWIGHAGASQILEGLRSNFELENLYLESGRLPASLPVHKEITHWIRLNKAGRRIFRQVNVPQPVWPKVYGRITSDSDILFHFLIERPDVLEKRVDTKPR